MIPRVVRLCAASACLAALATASPAPAQTANLATFVFVNGLVGSDLSTQYLPTLPLDVSVNGVCLARTAISFGGTAGPYPIAGGTYAVSVAVADTLAPCGGQVLLSGNVTLQNGQQAAIVAAESLNSDAVLETYPLQGPSNAIGSSTILFTNAADIGAVDATFVTTGGQSAGTIANIAHGQQGQLSATAFALLRETIVNTGTTTAVAGPINLQPQDRNLVGNFLVGAARTGTLQLINVPLAGQF